MEKLFSEVKQFTEGMLVKGRILEVRPNEVLVDIGYKSEGSISLSEFDDPDAVKQGDEIGPATILARLEVLQADYGEDRYRASPLLRKRVRENRPLLS